MHDITQGTIITPSCTVNNAGTGPTPSGNAVDGKPILRATWKIDGTIIGFGEYGLAVPPGSTITMTMTSLPGGAPGTTYNTSGLTVGPHTISCEMDAPNFIVESNETNNVLTLGFNVLAPSGGSRPGQDWPFDTLAPVNLPVGSGATADTRMPAGYFNSWGSWNSNNGFGESVFGGNAPDVNIAQTINLSIGTEGHVSEIGGAAAPHAGDRLWIRDWYRFGSNSDAYNGWVDMPLTGLGYNEPNGWTHSGHTNNPGAKSNVAGFSNMWGALRTYDLRQGIIQHAGAVKQPGNAGASTRLGPGPDGVNFCWPANAWDNGQTYSGLCPIGSLLFIPANIDVTTLGLTTAAGLLVAHQAQDYGFYVFDSTFSNPGEYKAEANCYNRADFMAFRNSSDMGKIGAQLRRMLNNTQALQTSAQCAGGGTPRAALAPTTLT